MNKVILIGRLTADAELKQTQNGTSVARFSLAVNRRFSKDNEQTADFISCIAWKHTAEFICKYFRKGSMIAVSGRIQTGSYTDNNGVKRYTTDVVVEEAYFTGEKQNSGTAANTVASQGNANYVSMPDADVFRQAGFSQADGFDDGDVPF